MSKPKEVGSLDLHRINNDYDNGFDEGFTNGSTSWRDRIVMTNVGDEGDQSIIEEYLSEDKLRAASGFDDILTVKYLELIVNTTENSLSALGEKMPALTQLKLNDSTITSIRDLGTSLNNVTILWLSRCGLTELDGMSLGFSAVTELYLSFNSIKDLSPLGDLPKLQILDLEGNSIDNLEQVDYLATCSELMSLTLEANPIAQINEYRSYVAETLPQTQYLDDLPLHTKSTHSSVESSPRSTADQRELDMLHDAIKQQRIGEMDDSLHSSPIIIASTPRPSTSQGMASPQVNRTRAQSAWGNRPGSSMSKSGFGSPINSRPGSRMNSARPGSGGGMRPGTSNSNRPGTALRLQDVEPEEDSSSQLTYGAKAVICGNPVASLRKRKKEIKQIKIEKESPREETLRNLQGLSSDSENIVQDDHDDILEELKNLKRREGELLNEDWSSDEDNFETVNGDLVLSPNRKGSSSDLTGDQVIVGRIRPSHKKAK